MVLVIRGWPIGLFECLDLSFILWQFLKTLSYQRKPWFPWHEATGYANDPGKPAIECPRPLISKTFERCTIPGSSTEL